MHVKVSVLQFMRLRRQWWLCSALVNVADSAPRRSQTSVGLTNEAGNVLQHVVLLFHAFSGERDGSAATLGSLADVASWRKSVLASLARLRSLQATCLLDRSSGWLSGQLFCCGRPSLLPTGPAGDSRGKHCGAIASCATACPLSSLPAVELACGRRLTLLALQRLEPCAENLGGEPSPLKILAVLQVHAGVRTLGMPTLHSTQSLLCYKYSRVSVLAAVELHMESGLALFPTGPTGRLVRQAPWCHSNMRYSAPIDITASCGTCLWPPSCIACTAAARALRACALGCEPSRR